MLRTCLLLALLVACSDKSRPPAAGSGSGSAPGSGSAGSGSAGSGSAGPQSSLEIPLPKLSGKPPAKTSKPLDQAQLEQLSKLEYPGFTREVRKLATGFLEVTHKTKARPRFRVQVTIMRCLKCIPMEVDRWRADRDGLIMTVHPELRERPDTVFEIGESTLGGQKVIYTYQLGLFVGKDEIGNVRGAFTNAYILYHNDGVNQIRVIAAYGDDGAATKEQLAQQIPRERLEAAATAFLDAYTQAWAN